MSDEEQKPKSEDPIGCLHMVIAMAMGVPTTLYAALILVKTWAWFVVPSFGVSQLTYARSVGLVQFFDFFAFTAIYTLIWPRTKDTSLKSTAERWFARAVIYSLAFGEAYLFHLAIG